MGPWVHGSMGQWVHGSYECTGSWMTYEPMNLWTYGPMDLWTHGPLNLWTLPDAERASHSDELAHVIRRVIRRQ